MEDLRLSLPLDTLLRHSHFLTYLNVAVIWRTTVPGANRNVWDLLSHQGQIERLESQASWRATTSMSQHNRTEDVSDRRRHC